MFAKYILAVMAVAFLIAAAVRRAHTAQSRTWLLIAVIFGAVSLWLFSRG
jgi:hypothetical protein